jgi:hypothetical protein
VTVCRFCGRSFRFLAHRFARRIRQRIGE